MLSPEIPNRWKLSILRREIKRKGVAMLYIKRFSFLFVLLLILASAFEARAQQKTFDLHGVYLEGCTCKVVCPCDLEGAMVKGCHVMGAMIITKGSYENYKLSDMKIAFAVTGKWVRIYVQTKDSVQNQVAREMSRVIFGSYGVVESIRNAEIELSGKNGSYSLKVDGGKVIDLKTEPVLGANGKTAVTYMNYPDPLFETIMQARVISGNYNDGSHRFTLEGTNSFFNQNWKTPRR